MTVRGQPGSRGAELTKIMLVSVTIVVLLFTWTSARNGMQLLLPLLLVFHYVGLQISPMPTSSEEV